MKGANPNIRVVINCAGGYQDGDVRCENVLQTSANMWDVNVLPSVAASHLASHVLQKDGLLILTGAAPVLHAPTPKILAYGISKAAIHHLVESLASEDAGLPEGVKAIGMLPTKIDTPMNRKFNPNDDFTTWTPTLAFSQQVLDWATKQADVQQGGLYVFETKSSKTKVYLANHPTGSSSKGKGKKTAATGSEDTENVA